LVYDNIGVRDRKYTLDEVFPDSVTNKEVYAGTLQPLIECVRTGFNVACFAYGMTGAGKTHTMFGSDSEPGIANLAIDDLFVASSDGISVSFLEIYNEQVKDLLRSS
jgi:kinesin family protein 18/19